MRAKRESLEIYNGWHGGRGTLLVAQLVEALSYKQGGRGLDSRWCHCNFSLTHTGRTVAVGLTQPLT